MLDYFGYCLDWVLIQNPIYNFNFGLTLKQLKFFTKPRKRNAKSNHDPNKSLIFVVGGMVRKSFLFHTI